MKHSKKAALALLATMVLGVPTLASCGGGSSTTSSEAVVTVTKLEVTKMPTKVDYETGDIFDPTGMEITASFSDGTKEVVTDYSYSKSPLETNQKSITIIYKGKTVEVPITVTFVLKCKTLEVQQMPNKTKYVVGETFDPTGMKVVGHWTDGTSKVISNYTYDLHDPLTVNDTVVTISYDEKEVEGNKVTTTIVITVEEEAITGIKVTKLPTKMAYVIGETFDPTGMEVSTVTNKGTLVKLDEADYEIVQTEALTAEDDQINIIYQEKYMTTLTISVTESRLIGIEISRLPNIKEYKEGQKFDTTGMEVKALYEDESSAVLEAGKYEIDNTGELTVDDTFVNVIYCGFSQKVEIKVNPGQNRADITEVGTIRVEAEDLNTTKAFLRPDFIAAGRTFIEPGANASGGANVCGYNPGSIFEVPVTTQEDCEVTIVARMSDTDLNWDINKGVQFKMDDTVLLADDPGFTYQGTGDFWNWKEFKVGTASLKKGEHTFTFTSVTNRPNLDCFDFIVTKYGDDVREQQLVDLVMETAPTKTTYAPGEKFDTTGMKIVAKYDDYSSKELTKEDYTIDKEVLGEEDDLVTITYENFKIEIPVLVGEDYLLKVNKTGNKRVEAESLPTDEFIYRPDFVGQSYVKDNASASGGKSIEGYDVGSKTSFEFYVGEQSKAHLSIGVSNAEDVTLDDVFTIKLDGEVLDSDNPTLGMRYANDWYNWVEADYGSIDLTEGLHTISIEFTNAHPNLDYLNFFTYEYGEDVIEHTLEKMEVTSTPKTTYVVGEKFDPTNLVLTGSYADSFDEVITDYEIVDGDRELTLEDKEIVITYQGLEVKIPITVKNPEIIVDEAKEYIFEAEHIDTSTLKDDGGNFIENSGDVSSNGQNLGHIASGYMELLFQTKETMNLTITVMFAFPEEVMASDKIENFVVDDKVYSFGTDVEDVKCGPADGNMYWNYKELVINVGQIEAGLHSFRINVKGGGNYDCFHFNFSK